LNQRGRCPSWGLRAHEVKKRPAPIGKRKRRKKKSEFAPSGGGEKKAKTAPDGKGPSRREGEGEEEKGG